MQKLLICCRMIQHIACFVSILQNRIMSCQFVLGADFLKAVNNYEIINVTFVKYENICCINLQTHTQKHTHTKNTHICRTHTQIARRQVCIGKIVIIIVFVCVHTFNLEMFFYVHVCVCAHVWC